MHLEQMNTDLLEIMSLQEKAMKPADSIEESQKRKLEVDEKKKAFLQAYGFVLEGVLMDIYDEYSPDTSALPVVDYISKRPPEKQDRTGLPDGAKIEADDYADQDVRLVLLPNPVRFVMIIDGNQVEEVWNSEKQISPFV